MSVSCSIVRLLFGVVVEDIYKVESIIFYNECERAHMRFSLSDRDIEIIRFFERSRLF